MSGLDLRSLGNSGWASMLIYQSAWVLPGALPGNCYTVDGQSWTTLEILVIAIGHEAMGSEAFNNLQRAAMRGKAMQAERGQQAITFFFSGRRDPFLFKVLQATLNTIQSSERHTHFSNRDSVALLMTRVAQTDSQWSKSTRICISTSHDLDGCECRGTVKGEKCKRVTSHP